MKRRQWTNQEKCQIVLEGLKGEISVAEICNKHGIHQAQYQKWRSQFLSNAFKAFETGQKNRREKQLEKKVSRMEAVIGQLTMELKKTEEWL